MERKTFGCGAVIFRQGEESDCMYIIQSGKVGVFLDYGGPDEIKITEMNPGMFLGEMGILDTAPRSATAVSLEDGTTLEVVAEADFQTFFQENPDRLLLMIQQMSARLRRVTRDYAGVCHTVHDVLEAEKAGEEKSPALRHRIAKTLAGYESSGLSEQT